MNSRQRFVETVTFGNPDRVFYSFGGPRASTLLAWHKQGLPRTITSRGGWSEFVGSDPIAGLDCLDRSPMPPFEGGWTEEVENGLLLTITPLRADDPRGPAWRTVTFKPEDLPTPGFETRHWVGFPVRDRETFQELTRHFDPTTAGHYAATWLRRTGEWNRRDCPLTFTVSGLWMQIRHWTGFEGLCVLCAEDPGLVRDMMEFWADFNMALLTRVLEHVELDEVIFDEDIAYKTASMISPAMVKKIMWPPYRRMIRFFRERGVTSLRAASDGYLGELIPLWLAVGFNGISPIEIAAGNDLIEYRKKYGKDLFMSGGIDKRELTKTKAEVRAEVLSKVPYLLETGGYIPTVDHAVPPDVPVRNYLYCIELIKEIGCYGGSSEVWEPTGELEKRLGPIEEMWSPDQVLGRELHMKDYGTASFVPMPKAQVARCG